MSCGSEWNPVLDLQEADGSFPSQVEMGGKRIEDRNGFVTALVLRCLPNRPRTAAAVDRAVAFLARCESSDRPGAFGFWPRGSRPVGFPRLPPDTDDTSVLALELARRGRIGLQALRRIALTVLVPSRLRSIDPPTPPWISPGVFPTWIDRRRRANPVDCAVNANVAGLLAAAGLRHVPGYREACEMLDRAVVWAAGSDARLHSLTPFYPHPGELLLALEHAVRAGARELGPTLHAARRAVRPPSAPDVERPICSAAYGGAVWRCPALHLARRLAARSTTLAGRPPRVAA